MNDRERLVELFQENEILFANHIEEALDKMLNKDIYTTFKSRIEFTVDHLIANGVTIQKHGRWDMKDTAYGCSLCGHGMFHPWSNYCPNCGAKMEVNHD